MKTLVTNYTFSATTKQVTFTDYPSIKLDQILLITNVTDNIIIYNFADPTAGGTLAGNVLTLTYNTAAMSNTDRLQIFIDDYTVPSTEASLTAVRIRIDNTNTLLNVLTARQDTINITATAINLNTDEVEGLIKTTNSNLTGINLNATTINQSVSTTNLRLSSIDVKLTTLINQTDGIEGSLNGIANNTSFRPFNTNTTKTVQLSNSLNCGAFYIWSIHGTSFANYDQYLQVWQGFNPELVFTQKIKANENFEFNFRPIGAGYIAGGNPTIVYNSLTPFTLTPGNNDLYLFVRGESSISTPGGPG